MRTDEYRNPEAVTSTHSDDPEIVKTETGYVTLPIGEDVYRTYATLMALPIVQQALRDIHADDARTFDEQKTITEIPAPPFKEAPRATFYLGLLKAAGLVDAYLDTEGNVIGVRRGIPDGPTLVVSAHLDTVFPVGTDVTVKERDGRYFAPGLRDDARGLAALLSVARALCRSDITTVGTIMFVGTVGEEGAGDLRGVKALFREHTGIDGFVTLDYGPSDAVVTRATGSRRYDVIFRGKEGHSFNAFGLPSAIHAMGRAIARISCLEVPRLPKTSFNVGTVRAGTSVTSIAGEARMGLDIRSNDSNELLKIENTIVAEIKQAVKEETLRDPDHPITVEMVRVGNRPAGANPDQAKIIQVARHASLMAGIPIRALVATSTDANVPISLGIPAMMIDPGGTGGGEHSLGEWYDPTDAYVGAQRALLIILGLVGIHDSAGIDLAPLLERRCI
ncbi:M20/M25/M40 family metallo-hydrolase [Caballeronia sordidicola]|uniref:Peptidase M20 n=1 Tax=Caballeronia sordidicola TaxID=196367 RepID=A0A226WMF9_CABSO|nr:M20/M25/M40 family metallo-hydrolase [Caballeronia sordidicola]OXC71778.1 peptidase M20 [Caballeronia sordidicola]